MSLEPSLYNLINNCNLESVPYFLFCLFLTSRYSVMPGQRTCILKCFERELPDLHHQYILIGWSVTKFINLNLEIINLINYCLTNNVCKLVSSLILFSKLPISSTDDMGRLLNLTVELSLWMLGALLRILNISNKPALINFKLSWTSLNDLAENKYIFTCVYFNCYLNYKTYQYPFCNGNMPQNTLENW